MKSIEFDRLDGGRLIVNRAFRGALHDGGLLSFEAIMDPGLGLAVKATLSHRTTVRLDLETPGPPRAFYIKRHGPAPIREYFKPLIRLRRPLIGARDEWEALLRFRALGIPTMTPVAFGCEGRRSFVMTEALEGCTRLSTWVDGHGSGANRAARIESARLALALADIARTMHGAGLHHQDFYLNHFLRRDGAHADGERGGAVYVIDLGRVRRYGWPALRWIVKDLAQLEFSADGVGRTDRMRFLKAYLGRPRSASDRLMLRLVHGKARAIARRQRRKAARAGGG